MRIGNLAASSFQSVTATEDDGSSPLLQYLPAAQAVEEHAKKERKLQDEQEKLQETGGQDLEALFQAPTRVISACRSRAPGARAWHQQTVTSDVDAAGLATLHG